MKVSLKRDGWYCRLQEYVLDYNPKFNSFCPMFWTTIFCMMVLPFIWIAKKFVVLWHKTIDRIDAFFERLEREVWTPRREAALNRMVLEMDDHTLMTAYEISAHSSFRDPLTFSRISEKHADKFIELFRRWQNATPNWEYKLSEARARWNKRRDEIFRLRKERLEKAEKIAERRKQNLAKIVKYTKYLAIGPVAVLAVGLIWAVAKLLGWVGHLIYTYPHYFAIIVGVVVAAGVFVLLCYGAVHALRKWSDSRPPKPNRVAPRPAPRRAEPAPRSSFVEFFVMYFDAAKKNYCPAIEWDDEEKQEQANG